MKICQVFILVVVFLLNFAPQTIALRLQFSTKRHDLSHQTRTSQRDQLRLNARPDRPLGRITKTKPSSSLTPRPYQNSADADLLNIDEAYKTRPTTNFPSFPFPFSSPAPRTAAPALSALLVSTTAVTGTQIGATMLAFPQYAANLDASLGSGSLTPLTAGVFLTSYVANLLSGFYIVDCFASAPSDKPTPNSYSSLTDAYLPFLTPVVISASTLINAGVLVFALYSFPGVFHEVSLRS